MQPKTARLGNNTLSTFFISQCLLVGALGIMCVSCWLTGCVKWHWHRNLHVSTAADLLVLGGPILLTNSFEDMISLRSSRSSGSSICCRNPARPQCANNHEHHESALASSGNAATAFCCFVMARSNPDGACRFLERGARTYYCFTNTALPALLEKTEHGTGSILAAGMIANHYQIVTTTTSTHLERQENACR